MRNGKWHIESHYPTQAKERLEWGTQHPAFVAVRMKLQVPVRLRSGQALPYATPDFLSRLVALANFVRLSYGKPHTGPGAVPRCRKSESAPVPRQAGTGGMTKLRAVANLKHGWRWMDRVERSMSFLQRVKPSPAKPLRHG
jgi:hypothetical protein